MVKTKKKYRINTKTTRKKIKKKQKDYIVAIPTYKRYEQVYNKTISTLLRNKVSFEKIHLFVANKKEYNEYAKILPKNCYNKIIIGKKGIKNQRNFMNNYFKEGTKVLYMDDDIESIVELNGSKLREMKNLDKFIRNAFKECIKKNLYLWGIYPVPNEFFMIPRPKKSYDLRFIIGTFFGQIIRHSKDLRLTVEQKVDVENTILHYKKDGGVLRYEKVSMKTKYYNPNGGILAEMTKDRMKVNEESAKQLERKYPEYGHAWQRSNGRYEFKLKPLDYKLQN